MHRIVKRLDFSYGHRLLDYEGKCSRPHGHNGLVEVELAGDLDHRGMVLDFTEVKEVLRSLLEPMDHRMILRQDDPLIGALEAIGEKACVMAENPTAENIARVLFLEARKRGLPVVAVRLWETRDSLAEYRE